METGQALLENEIAQLYNAYAASLLHFAAGMKVSPEQADDAVQETFLRYYMERRYGRAIEQPRAWMFRVLRNYLLNALQSAASKTEPAALEQVPDASAGPESLLDRRERAREIAGRLTSREMECLRLRAEGLSYAEIAATLSIRPGTVGAQLHKIYRKLRATPGSNGKICLGTASAIRCLFLEAQSESS